MESVLAQSIPNVRALIIDDASPDNTSEIASDLARNDSRVTFIKHPVNKGHIATYNEGIEWAASDYMLLLSADDYLLPGALSRAASLMDAHPDVTFTFGNAMQLDPLGAQKPIRNVHGRALSVVSGRRFIELSTSRNIVPTPTAVVRTEVQHRVGGYRPELTHSGDMEMWLRLAAYGSVGMLSSYQAVYRRHEANMSLTYMEDHSLPDIKQRKAAVDYFLASCGHLLANSEQLKARFYRALAKDAVDSGGAAFNAGRAESLKTLCDFALETCPTVHWSVPWAKLTCKRIMGPTIWNVLHPAVRALRRK